MSTRRQKHRHIPSSTFSDFEGVDSDLQYLSDNFAAPPTTRTDTELNLAVLRRLDQQILDLHHVSPYAVVYAFSSQTSAWEKVGCEGSAFLVSLLPNATHSVRYAVLVLNRRGMENFEIELQSTEEIELTEEYIILQGNNQDGTPSVYGLWVFAEPEPASTARQREVLSQKILAAAEQVEHGRRDPGAPVPQAQHIQDGYNHGADMALQGSLTAMLEQQRQQDDAWSVRSHSPANPVPQAASTFLPSGDTDVFLSARPTGSSSRASPSPAISNQGSLNSNIQQKESLLELFRKAGENYRGTVS